MEMRRNLAKILCLSALIIFAFLIVNVEAASINPLFPNSGKVGTQITLTGNLTVSNSTYIVWFDINNNGNPFDAGENLTAKTVGSGYSLNVSVIVPSCVGSDSGVNHTVALQEAVGTSNMSTWTNFSVITSRNLTAPSTIQTGDYIPISINVTGGFANSSYGYNFMVTRPDGTVANASLTINSTSIGDASGTLNYPTQFPTVQNTDQSGTYSVLVNELYPNSTIVLQATVQAQPPPTIPPTPTILPNATISSIQPNSAVKGSTIYFSGFGVASGAFAISSYRWTSNISGVISTSRAFNTSTLPVGNHAITFEVQDSNGTWSLPTQATLVINPQTPNQPPIAHLDATPPSSIVQGQRLMLTGYGTDVDGTVVSYLWVSNISGTVSTSSQLDTSNLLAGIHRITFQVSDNNGTISDPITIVLAVEQPASSLFVIVGGATVGGGCAVTVGCAAVWVHYNNLTSAKVQTKLNQKKAKETKKEQEKEEKDKKKREKEKKKETPYLAISSSTVPSHILKDTTYQATLNVENKGNSEAKNITVTALTNPYIEFENADIHISSLEAGQTKHVDFAFTTSQEIRKLIYQQQFCASNPQSSANKSCFMRGGRIALLSDAETPEKVELVKDWLFRNHYPFEEIHDAAHLMTELYNYDLIIVAPEMKMPSKWVTNLCTYVENSQSLLLIDQVETRKPQLLYETLGYKHAQLKALNAEQSGLKICKAHPVTAGFSVGDQLSLGTYTGKACVFEESASTATVLALNIGYADGTMEGKLVPAVTVKATGKGKIVHLNFNAQTHLDQIEKLLTNAIEWLLWS